MEIYRKQKPKEKRPTGRQPTFTNEFMMMVAKKVVEEGMSYRAACKTFGISSGSITNWKKMYLGKKVMKNAQPLEEANSSKIFRLEESIKELKEEIGNLYLENTMLKKALLRSQQLKKQNSSVITSENLDQFREDVK